MLDDDDNDDDDDDNNNNSTLPYQISGDSGWHADCYVLTVN
jgi:hypothetical protein